VTVHNSDIVQNITQWATAPGLELGMINESQATVDAISNWWGDASGPYNDPDNLSGLGNSVSGNVDFDPWLTQAQ